MEYFPHASFGGKVRIKDYIRIRVSVMGRDYLWDYLHGL